MLFRAENLGPIQHAEVDLTKDLIVLAGPNNTGKTYLAWSLYALLLSAPGQEPPLLEEIKQGALSREGSINWERLAHLWQKLASHLAGNTTRTLHRSFAARKGLFDNAKVELSVGSTDELSQRLKKELGRALESGQGWVAYLSKKPGGAAHFDLREPPRLFNEVRDPSGMRPEEQKLEAMLYFLLRQMPRVLLPDCALFPAERIAINTFAKELALQRIDLVDALLGLDDEPSSELIRRRARWYPLPIRNGLLVANSLGHISQQHSAMSWLADELEATLLGGKLSLSQEGDVLFAPAEAAGTQARWLDIHLTASVVRSLASLVLYFRHMAQVGDFIILDEPELGLHPDSQSKLARILAKAVNHGVRVMISTHSDYVLQEMTHLIMMSHSRPIEERMIKEFGYPEGCALLPGKVGVYLLKDRRATPVPVTELGFSIQTIDDEINRLNRVTQNLYLMLE